MLYVVNKMAWPMYERARAFRDMDSAQHFLDRRARFIEHKYGEPEARRYIANAVIFSTSRKYYWYAVKNTIWIVLLGLLIAYCIAAYALV